MKKVLWMLSSIVLIVLMYYLFVRPHEFEANFKSNTLPGDIIGTIRIWNRSLDSAKIVEVDSFSSLRQTIVWRKRSYVYDWNFVALRDSVTKVNVRISEPGRSLLNKLLVPFTHQAIEEDASEIVNEFYGILKEHLRITDVQVKGVTELDSSFCACTSLKTRQMEKANGMMKDFVLLTSFIEKFKLKSAGHPTVRVQEWNHSLGQLKFYFCFPIVPPDSLPSIDSITFQRFGKQKVLKAEFYGNYITSDRAWYALLQHAEKNGYKTTGLPIEYFYDNPNLGLNERKWKAEVYLPVEDK